MKRTAQCVAACLFCFLASLANTTLANDKTIFINGQKAQASKIKQIESAFGVTLVPNSHFILDNKTGNFYQAEDRAYIGNIYEYTFSQVLEKIEIQTNNSSDKKENSRFDTSDNRGFKFNLDCVDPLSPVSRLLYC